MNWIKAYSIPALSKLNGKIHFEINNSNNLAISAKYIIVATLRELRGERRRLQSNEERSYEMLLLRQIMTIPIFTIPLETFLSLQSVLHQMIWMKMNQQKITNDKGAKSHLYERKENNDRKASSIRWKQAFISKC